VEMRWLYQGFELRSNARSFDGQPPRRGTLALPLPLWGYLGRKWSGFMGLAEGVALKYCIDEGYA